MGWTKSVLLWPLIPKICSYKQLSKPPWDVSRVNEPETAKEAAFDILSTLKIKANTAFGKGPLSFSQIQSIGKMSQDVSPNPERSGQGPALVIMGYLQLVSFQSNYLLSSSDPA